MITNSHLHSYRQNPVDLARIGYSNPLRTEQCHGLEAVLSGTDVRPRRPGRQGGFTLIEVIIAIAIIGILGALAYPQYGSYVQKSRRTDGHMALLQEVQALERCKTTSYSYAGCTLSSNQSAEGYYALTIELDATSYTLTATGQGPQAQDTGCKTLTLNHQGIRTPDPDSTDCWAE